MCLTRIALLGALCATVLGSKAQGFNKRYDAFGQGNAQGAFGIERTGDHFLVFAASYEPDTVSPDSLLGIHSIIFQWIDSDGVLLSERRHKLPQHSLYLGAGNCCDSVEGGGYVTGGTWENLDLDQRIRLIRYDAYGDTLWTQDFGDASHYWGGEQVISLSDGGFLIVGFTNATGVMDGFAIRTDPQGEEVWRHTYGWTDPVYRDGFVAGGEGTTSDLYMSGSRFLSNEDDQFWIQRTDGEGELIWSTSWGGPYPEGAAGLTMLADGHPLVASGTGYQPAYTSMRPYLAKIDTVDGSRIWEREYGPAIYSTLFFLAKEAPNTDLIAAGVTYEGGHEQGLLLRATSEGDSLWMRKYWYHDDVMDQGQGRFYDVLPTDDGGFIAAGFANGSFSGGLPPGYSQDAWVVKVDGMGCIVPGCDATGVSEIVTNLRDALTLFPNPAHGQVSIQLHLPTSYASKDLRLSLVSSDGRVVRQVPWRSRAAMVLDVQDLSPGLYTMHVTDGGTWVTGGKLIIE